MFDVLGIGETRDFTMQKQEKISNDNESIELNGSAQTPMRPHHVTWL